MAENPRVYRGRIRKQSSSAWAAVEKHIAAMAISVSKQQIESIELTADLTLERGRQGTAIARLQLVEPLASIATHRLVAGTGSPPPPLGYAQAGWGILLHNNWGNSTCHWHRRPCQK